MVRSFHTHTPWTVVTVGFGWFLWTVLVVQHTCLLKLHENWNESLDVHGCFPLFWISADPFSAFILTKTNYQWRSDHSKVSAVPSAVIVCLFYTHHMVFMNWQVSIFYLGHLYHCTPKLRLSSCNIHAAAGVDIHAYPFQSFLCFFIYLFFYY